MKLDRTNSLVNPPSLLYFKIDLAILRYFLKKNYLLIWLHRVLAAECSIFSCFLWDLVP